MNIVSINTTHRGSTGKIMLAISDYARQHGNTAVTFSTTSITISPKKLKLSKPEKLPNILGHNYYGGYYSNLKHICIGILSGKNGCFSHRATRKLIAQINAIHPDLIHLHNIHGFCLNIPMLFSYFKKQQIPVIWTLHDCWSFTGRCAYFDMAQCDRWKTGCGECRIAKNEYPASYIDRSAWMWEKKKTWFSNLPSLVLVTPSRWLAALVGESFLGQYPIRVIHNGIDLNVFRPTEGDFRRRYRIPDSMPILLGVSFSWGIRKGIDVFQKLAERLKDEMQIVLVGTTDAVDATLPDHVITIHRTDSQKELAELYSAADVFVNPTREDNYPTVNMEAIACGTPVVTFDTGGSPEALGDDCGIVTPQDDLDALMEAIRRILADPEPWRRACLCRAKEFDQNDRYAEYLELFQSVCTK